MTTPPEPPPTSPSPVAGGGPRRGRGRILLIVGSTVWAVALLAAAVFSYHRDAPTVREQRTIAQAAPVIDRAVGELVAASEGVDVALEITPWRLTAGCRLTSSWTGATLERSLIVRTVEGAAPAVLDRVAERLPERYRAGLRRDGDGAARKLVADAGEFVRMTGAITSPGVVTLSAKSGCRPPSPEFDPAATLLYERAPLPHADVALMAANAEDITNSGVTMVPCPTGMLPAVTEHATGTGALSPEERKFLAKPGMTTVITDTATEFAMTYGHGVVSLLVRDGNDRLESVMTRGCARL